MTREVVVTDEKRVVVTEYDGKGGIARQWDIHPEHVAAHSSSTDDAFKDVRSGDLSASRDLVAEVQKERAYREKWGA